MGSKERQSVKSARTQTKPKTDGFFAIHVKQARASLSALWHRPLGNVLTLAVISMALALPACLYLLGKNVAEVASTVASPSQVSAYLQENIPEARIMVLKDDLEREANIDHVDYISSQQGLDDLSQYSGFDKAISLLDDYSLPGVLVVTPSVSDTRAIQAIARQLSNEQGVSDVRLDEDWLTRLDAMRNLVGVIVSVLSALMLISVFLVVGNTLRFNVLENKDEIQTMKLIGATDRYILRPYLYSGLWFGLIGAGVAWFLTEILTMILNSHVEALSKLYDSQFQLIGLSWDESLLLLMLGVFIGSLAARISAQRHLKEIEPV